MSKLTPFFLTVAVTAGALLTLIYANRPERRLVPTNLTAVREGLFVTSQLQPKNIPYLLGRGGQMVVDIRSDGEADGQPSSIEIMRAADELNIRFHYIPVPHGPIPNDAVCRLREVLTGKPSSTVLYCRTGIRAARTFALVEASQSDGPSADQILAQTHKAGFSASDLCEEISRRIAERDRSTNIGYP